MTAPRPSKPHVDGDAPRTAAPATGSKPRLDVDRVRYTISWQVDADAVAFDAAADGTFPLITNDRDMAIAGLLAAYRGQPHLERRNHTLKGVLDAAPTRLNSDQRIDALAFCLYAALLVHALIERTLRAAMAAGGIDHLPLYHEHRACTAPTSARVLEILEPSPSPTSPTRAGPRPSSPRAHPGAAPTPRAARRPPQRLPDQLSPPKKFA